MARHIFLTGEKQIGKSTLLRKVLAEYTGSVGGFLTIKAESFVPGRPSVHIFSPSGPFVFQKSNMLFVCGAPQDGISERFDDLGCDLLDKGKGASLTVMDELGFREEKARLFREKVAAALCSQAPVLGVIRSPAELYWPEIAERSDAEIIEITASNRDSRELFRHILSALPKAGGAV